MVITVIIIVASIITTTKSEKLMLYYRILIVVIITLISLITSVTVICIIIIIVLVIVLSSSSPSPLPSPPSWGRYYLLSPRLSLCPPPPLHRHSGKYHPHRHHKDDYWLVNYTAKWFLASWKACRNILISRFNRKSQVSTERTGTRLGP